MRPVLKSILSSSESRPIFYFLLLNLVYLFVQLIWGAWTNSLGLISDAVHMAFDCAALGVGLAASVMARWEKGGRWTYGYDRIQTLSGFANGVFLILISIFILFEGVQRIMNPPQMQNMTQLLFVSSGGLAINLWGMYATGHHHHGHSHGGGDCGHSHGNSANMRGVFLVRIDTLGSVGVIVSTVLINYTGLTVFDPIASLFIAGLIVASVIPLVVDSGRILCLELGPEKATEIRQALGEVSNLEGVASYGAARFWPADEVSLIGSIHIQLDVSRNAYDPSRPVDAFSTTAYLDGARENVVYANAEKVRKRVDKALRGRISGLKEMSIQVEGMAPNYCSCTT
ncbi:hypothetical protein FFLO_05903 [Filobasidium floriforme]|uniref:Cation efflux protein transmembrane domain-containing protein n=1 Tax=Filobasidium floriforme TaxID=5210 RepID=A0A8K0JHC9_9TREE|nr:CDF-like metal transporter [Filobasidium floriforme]KAG7528843.1 hypothetical protein FFLO_05903 [Filobasidium floriforme]KAH8086358.1 CDF-like metal transporter [Filobasidium floriforme]